MKKTTKTLFSLLLVLVMVLQFGAMAPMARADGAPVSIYVQAPIDNEGHLSSNIYSLEGKVEDSDVVNAMAELSDTSALAADGVVLTPPANFAVIQLGIVASGAEKSFEDVTSEFASFTEDETDHAAIVISSSFFSGKFDEQAKSYVLYVRLAPVISIAPKLATCGTDGFKEYHELASDTSKLYLDDKIPVIPATGEHTLEAVEAKDATCTEDGVKAHYKCSVCGKLFDGNGEDKKELSADDVKIAASHDLEHVAAVEPTAEKAGNIEYWECSVCEKYFSDEDGKEEITDKDSVIVPYVAPEVKHTVSFAAGDGTGTMEDVEVKEGDEYALPECAFTAPENKEFDGWKIGEETKQPGDKITVSEDVPVTAQWKDKTAPSATTFNVSFSAGDGTGTMESIKTQDGGKYIVPECGFTAPENKEFAYWLRGDEHLKPGDEDTITTDNALVAMWKDVAPAVHTHTLEKVPAKAATSVEDGNKEYWVCKDASCGKYFSDAEGKTEITDKASVIIKATGKPMTEGTDTEWKPGSTSGLKIHIDAVYSDTLKDTLVVKVGDAVVPQDKYTVTNGSVTVTIDPSYLSTLPAGDHTISITFPSGNTVSTTVTIPAAEPSVTALAFAIDEKGFTKVYDGASFDLNALKNYITLTNLPAGHKADIEITFENASVTEFHNVGTTTLKLHLKGVKDSADADVTSAFTCEDKTGVKLEITKRKLGVETRDDSIVYDGKPWSYPNHVSKTFNAYPIMTYTDAKLGEYVRDGKTYVQTISLKYTTSPKNMGTYENKAELIIREKEKGSSEAGTDVTANYEITYKFGKIKITDSKGNVPNSGVKTGDANNLWIWVGVMAAAVVLIVVLLFVMRKNKKNDAPTE